MSQPRNTLRAVASHLLPRLVHIPILFALAVTGFNLTVAVTPSTAEPPPVREIPGDVFLHEGWAEQNYIGQGRYLEHALGAVSITRYLDGPELGPVFYTGMDRWPEEILPASPLVTGGDMRALRMKGSDLLAQGSATQCFFPGGNERDPEWCSFEVIVHDSSLRNNSPVSLHLLSTSRSSIALIDDLLLSPTWDTRDGE